jgi:hypothetical protein
MSTFHKPFDPSGVEALFGSPRSVGFTYGYRRCCPSGNRRHSRNGLRLTLIGRKPWVRTSPHLPPLSRSRGRGVPQSGTG